jgi:hypothetical protein
MKPWLGRFDLWLVVMLVLLTRQRSEGNELGEEAGVVQHLGVVDQE